MEREIARAIEWDCTQLVTGFYCALDEQRYDDLAGLFATDGVWNRLGKDLVGGAAILEAMRTRKDWLTAHLVTNIRINVLDPEHAETIQYITLYRHEGWTPDMGPAPVVLPLGILKHWDKHVRIGGIWKIAHKRSRAMMADRSRVTHYDKP
jgi:hypothetical protein